MACNFDQAATDAAPAANSSSGKSCKPRRALNLRAQHRQLMGLARLAHTPFAQISEKSHAHTCTTPTGRYLNINSHNTRKSIQVQLDVDTIADVLLRSHLQRMTTLCALCGRVPSMEDGSKGLFVIFYTPLYGKFHAAKLLLCVHLPQHRLDFDVRAELRKRRVASCPSPSIRLRPQLAP
jgi:hypothetical protein